jgi:hypothetical protein
MDAFSEVLGAIRLKKDKAVMNNDIALDAT